MLNNAVTITITRKKVHPKIYGITNPFSSGHVCYGTHKIPNEGEYGYQGGPSPLECLTHLLLDAEMNRKPGRIIGPIHAVFDLPDSGGSYGIALEKMLQMYARSEHTNVTFEYKK